MRRTLLALAMTVALGMMGCGRTSQSLSAPKTRPHPSHPAARGPGGSAESEVQPSVSPIPSSRPTNTAKLSVGTTTPVSVEKGKSVTATIPIQRSHYDGNVKVVVAPPADSGITIEPTNALIHEGQGGIPVTLHAAQNAKPGKIDMTVRVRGVASGTNPAPEATGHLTVNVQ